MVTDFVLDHRATFAVSVLLVVVAIAILRREAERWSSDPDRLRPLHFRDQAKGFARESKSFLKYLQRLDTELGDHADCAEIRALDFWRCHADAGDNST